VRADVAIIGSGPAGMAAAVAACERGARTYIVEREARPGGILKQCIHDGFGLVLYGEKLTGPEYAHRDILLLKEMGIPILTGTFPLALEQKEGLFRLTLQNSEQGIFYLSAGALVAATGCRERTSRQVFIHGERPAGIYTAGTVQNLVNIRGYLPGRECIILGSGDIGLIMARRLRLEGANVAGVYEIRPEPAGLMRNVVQCLHDYNIPLHLNSTVTRVHGRQRVKGVTVGAVGPGLRPVGGSDCYVPCDTLVLSVGLIPENDLLDPLGVEMDPRTGGPVVDQNMMSSLPGLFSCGNALHVNTLVDYVSESGKLAGAAAADFADQKNKERLTVPLVTRGALLYAVPQRVDFSSQGKVVIYFRSSGTLAEASLLIRCGRRILLQKKYTVIRPSETGRISFDTSLLPPDCDYLEIELLEGERHEANSVH
jgi:thioredoxin reductase